MATSTTSNKRRQPGRKAEDIQRAWKNQAPDAVFAGKALADLDSAIAALDEASESLAIQAQARSAALKVRDERLEEVTSLSRVIVRGVQGHPDYGDDSPLYRAMGFVPFSERGSGLTRSSSTMSGETTASEEAAA